MTDLERTIGYAFRNASLLEQALTTPACHMDRPEVSDNQRLEFLGDAVFGLLSADAVYAAFPADAEGLLTVRRTHLVSGAALADAAERLRLRDHLKNTDIEVIPISAATGEGIVELTNAVIRMLPTLPETVVYEEEADEESEDAEPFTVTKEDGLYVVAGPLCERLLAGTNFDSTESAAWFHRRLRTRGVIDALRAAGAKEGDTVLFGDMEFDFVE